MSEIVNLNRARKAKARRDSEEKAAGNRVRFGRTKAQKESDRAAQAKAERSLDQAKREEP